MQFCFVVVQVSGPGIQSAVTGVATKVTVRGPESGLVKDRHLRLEVQPSKADAMPPSTRVEDKYDGSYYMTYTLHSAVEHRLSIWYKDQLIPGAPFTIQCKQAPDASACRVLGGDETPNFVGGDNIMLTLDTSSAGDGELTVEASAPGGLSGRAYVAEPMRGRKDILLPTVQSGVYRITCLWHGTVIPGFPKSFNVTENTALKVVKVTGDGLTKARALKEASFTVQAWDTGLIRSGTLKVRIDGEQGQLNQNITELKGRGTYLVSYIAPASGTYQITVLSYGKHILGSPFALRVSMPPQAQLCTAIGSCLDNESPVPQSAAEFSVNTSEGGCGELEIRCQAPGGSNVPAFQSVHSPGLYKIKVPAQESGRYTLDVLWSGDHIPGSPFFMNIAGQSATSAGPAGAMVNVSGSALTKAYVSTPAAFTIEAVPGVSVSRDDLAVEVEGTKKQRAEVNIRQSSPSTFSVFYVPPTVGAYLVSILYQGQHVHNSPFKVSVFQRPRPDKVVISGQHVDGQKYCAAGQQLPFMVATKNAGYGKLAVTATSPSGNPVPAYTAVSAEDKTLYMVKVDTAEAGKYRIRVKWNDVEVPRSPLKLRIYPPPDASKVVVGGPGISSILPIGEPTHIDIDATEAGFGQLTVHLRGPSASTIPSKVEKNPDNPRQVVARYTPQHAGEYLIRIKWSGVSVPHSPFTVNAIDRHAPPPVDRRPSSPKPKTSKWKVKKSISDRIFGSIEPDYPDGGRALARSDSSTRRQRAWSDEDIEAAQRGLWGGQQEDMPYSYGFSEGESPRKSFTVSSVTDKKIRRSRASQQQSSAGGFFSRKSKGEGAKYSRKLSSPAILQGGGPGYQQPMPFGGQMAFAGGARSQLSNELRGRRYNLRYR